MRNLNLIYCIIFCCCIILTSSFSVSNIEKRNNNKNLRDTTWKVKPIIRLNDPAPETGGSFLEFGKHYYLKSGVLVFWAKYGEDKKDWALYSLKDEKIRLVFRGHTDFTEPDGVKKKFSEDPPEFSFTTTRFIAKDNILYISFQKGLSDVICYGWDGEKFYKILGEGDKITVPDYGELIINSSNFFPLENKPGMKVFFTTQKPNKKEGCLLFDGTNYSILFIEGQELPGSKGIQYKQLLEGPVYFGDTMLVRLRVDNAPYKEAIFSITGNKSEKIIAVGDPHPANPEKQVVDLREFYASGPKNLVIDANSNKRTPLTASSTFLSYNNGNWTTIIESSDELKPPKGFAGYKVYNPVFINPDQDQILLPVSLGKTDISTSTSGTSIYSYFVPFAIYLFDGHKLITIAKDEMKIIFTSAVPAYALKVPGMEGAVVKLALQSDLKYFDFNLVNPALIPIPELKTEGNEKFLLSSIIAQRDENRFIATTNRTVETKRTKEIQVSGFFDLTRVIH